ncbi:MAG TPA: bacteriohopanetetrol glucosamine biosynthesis glycosyltransferase HpnI [Acidisphaera sp.]|nr:bacteriohopanetetrol glucosamine biosynthesis glycosyltransferase HpnI [Acidisphaera sp.]
MIALAIPLGCLAVAGAVQAGVAAAGLARFARRPPTPPVALPPVTVLKPLYGAEPMLEDALASFCAQDYPEYQIVFGVHASEDPAIAVVRRVAARFPARDIAVVVDATVHGQNGKVGNLINMLPEAKHDVLLISDSDVHVQPDYLRRLAAALEQDGVGLATTLYAGLPASRSIPALLGALQITETFLPGALMARALGREDCLGASMMLRRPTLERVGGFPALVDHLADDHILGVLVRQTGLSVRLADTVPATTVPESSFRALLRHELRWSRTIRTLAPLAHLASAVQYPIALALLALVVAPSVWTVALALGVWAVRASAAAAVARALRPKLGRLASRPALWLLPLRDVLSLAVTAASFAGRRVDWRGQSMLADGIPPEITLGHVPEVIRP